jgi:hypothetical protein
MGKYDRPGNLKVEIAKLESDISKLATPTPPPATPPRPGGK